MYSIKKQKITAIFKITGQPVKFPSFLLLLFLFFNFYLNLDSFDFFAVKTFIIETFETQKYQKQEKRFT